MKRRTLFKTLLAAVAVPVIGLWPKKASARCHSSAMWHHVVGVFKHPTTIPLKPLRVACNGEKYWSCVEVRDNEGKLKGKFEIRYNIKSQELFFALKSEEDSEASCLIDAFHPVTWDEVGNPIKAKVSSDGVYRIRMT